MSAKPAARKGDPTADGDSNPIDSGSPDVLFDGLPAAREGDTTECGSELCDQLSSTVLINGKAAVMVDSEGTAGNVVMSGSTTVLIGDACTLTTPSPKSNPKSSQEPPIQSIDTNLGSEAFISNSTASVLDYKIGLKRGGNRTLIPLEAPDFKNLPPRPSKSSELVNFTIQNKMLAADTVALEVISGTEVIYSEKDTAKFLSPGVHDWSWDGYSNSGILDTARLKNNTLKVHLTATKGNQSRIFEIQIAVKAKIDWLDALIDRGTTPDMDRAIVTEITLRPHFSDGGSTGASSSASTSYEQLVAWAKEGIEHYWSRNSTRSEGIASNISTPKGKSLLTMRVDLNSSPAAPTFKLIDNLSDESGRSTSLGGFRKIYHNLGPRIKSPFNPTHYATQEFKGTAAHEMGHLILNEYGGKTNYSWTHKGTSNLAQIEKPNNPIPRAGEIDLMHYFSEYEIQANDRYNRTAASEQDVRSLLYLCRLEFEISTKG